MAIMQTEGDRKVSCLLQDMGFDVVAENFVLQDYPESAVGEVDLVLESGYTMLLVEVSGGRNAISEKKRKFFDKWKEGPCLERLKKKLGRQPQRTVRAYFDLRPTPENPGEPEVSGIAEPGTMNRIYYGDDFNRFAESVKRGGFAAVDFLADFS